MLYFVAGLEAVAVAFFLGVGCSLLYYFVAVVVVEHIALLLRGALLRDAPLRCILPFGFAIGTAFGLIHLIGLVSNGP